ncbi:hypothetical protein DH2020_013221 [Rehmannia glutinosa]|uniref:Uncharacterized protein n=1 Tax=Rehmannia glutinosa TaxID=99300 RepID=A0ABR0X4U2_REHGL
MEKFSRSKSSREGPGVNHPSNMHDLRSYSTSDYNLDYKSNNFKEMKIKKSNKSRISASSSSSSSSKNWNFNVDPELQRKKRVAGYKAYAVEGKMKTSLRKSFRWMKDIVHGLCHCIGKIKGMGSTTLREGNTDIHKKASSEVVLHPKSLKTADTTE